MYFSIGGQLDGEKMLPGEGVTFERFGAISIGIGPNISLLGVKPISIGDADMGIFASAGLTVNLVRGHFITDMEVQKSGTLRVKLENINQNSEALSATVAAGANFEVLTFIYSLMHAEDGIVNTRETVLDMVVDPKYPQAAHALKLAYLGFFDPLQKLAIQADQNYQGVRDLGHTSMVEKGHERDFQFLGFDKGSEVSESKINTDSSVSAGASSDVSSEVTQSEMSRHRNTTRTQRDLDIRLQADDRVPDPMNHRTLSVRYKFHTKSAEPEELQQFLDVAHTLNSSGSADHSADLAQWQTELSTDHPTSRRGDLHVYFYLALDPTLVSSLFDSSDTSKFALFMTSWAQVLKLPNPEKWATMSPSQQDDAVEEDSDLQDHLSQLRKFLSALAKTLKSKDALEQDRIFSKAIRGENFDLYPFAALAEIADHSHMLAIERMTLVPTLTAEKTPQTIEIDNMGGNYQFPAAAVY
jgi:hypothetical protein